MSNTTSVSNEIIIAPTVTSSMNISTSNQKQSEHETPDLCLDDLLKESYEKLMKSNENEIQLIPQMVSGDNGFDNHSGVMTFDNNMTASSNYNIATNTSNNNFSTPIFHHSALETICEDSIKELLYGHVG